MTKPIEPEGDSTTTESPWRVAMRKCWLTVETASKLSNLMNQLDELPVAAVTPIISTGSPSILIAPVNPDDIEEIRLLCKVIRAKVESPTGWLHMAFSERWTFRLTVDGIILDINTNLPSVAEKPVEL